MNKHNAFKKAYERAQELLAQGYYPDTVTFKNPKCVRVYAKKINEKPISDSFPYKEASND